MQKLWLLLSTNWFIPFTLLSVAVIALFVLWKFPVWQVSSVKGLDSKGRFDRINEARKTLATILGGIVLMAGFFGIWQTLKVAEESASTSQQALLVSQEG